MFTEDDDKVVKKGSNNSDANFYTSFINSENSKKKKGSKKDKKSKTKDASNEEDYSNYYSSFLESERKRKEQGEKERSEAIAIDSKKQKSTSSLDSKNIEIDEYALYANEDDYPEVYQNDNGEDNKKNTRKMIIFAVEIIAVIILLLIVIFKTNLFGNQPGIVLTDNKVSINVGESYEITYNIVNTSEGVSVSYDSMNQEIAVVDNNGRITGILSGETDIIVSYTISGKTKEKKCHVTVTGEGDVNKDISLSIKLDNASENTWVNHDVTISVNASSIYGIKAIEYTTNCSGSNCKYTYVQNNKFTVKNNGTSTVSIFATDNSGKQVQKTVTVKIDKDAPTVIFNSGTNITGDNSVSVCATCKDSVSGCKNERVCTRYTSSQTNQKITVEDKAGNKATSPSFNVKVNKTPSNKCSLSVSSVGTVTATVPGGAKYYGFSSSYSGTNTKSQKVSISTKAGESKAKLINYYVKTSSGSKISCSITIIKECNASNKCSFRKG